MTTPDALTELVSGLRNGAASAFHRRLLVLSGSVAWTREQAAAVVALSGGRRLWVGCGAPQGVEAIHAGRAGTLLGQELELVVFDAFAGFDVDAFGAVSGTLRGGGLLLLLTPPLEEWPAYSDPEHARIAVWPGGPAAVSGRFLRRLAGLVRQAPGAVLAAEDRPLPPLPPTESAAVPEAGLAPCRTRDQVAAVEAVLRVAGGHRRRPLVLTSDRGRGKSAALGIAAARLLERGPAHIVVTGPRLEAATAVFTHAAALLPGAEVGRGSIRVGRGRLEFRPPDALAAEPVAANLVLVDEAAAIPAPLLESLLMNHARIVFATTVHGYEGTGRGFAIRFQQVLDAHTPGWRTVQLTTPVRWATADPVEAFVFRALALDAMPTPDVTAAAATPVDCTFTPLSREALAADEGLLGQIFGLLVSAHYRTRPLDLRHLLDGPNVTVWAATFGGQVVATALVTAEGGFDADTAFRVWAGRTRPHGHLLPETLAAHLGLEAAARLRQARVMRIAVHPAAQGRGIGSALLAAVAERAAAAGLDLIGTSFGATPELLRFWARAGYRPVRVSVKRGVTSGAHSALLLRPLRPAGEALAVAAADRFRAHLPAQLADPLQTLAPELVVHYWSATGPWPLTLTEADWRDLVAFAFGRRMYESCMGPIDRLVRAGLTPDLSPVVLRVLVAKVLQRRDYADVAAAAGLTGRAAVVTALRRALRPLVRQHGPRWVAEAAARLQAMWE